MYTAAVLTVSDRSFRGERPDEAGPLVASMLEAAGYRVVETAVVPDEGPDIEAALIRLAERAALVATTGGTGFSPRDVTPEATLAVCERMAPGIPEAMRAASLAVTPRAMLSRAAAGIRGGTLILNLPGSPKAARENLQAVLPTLEHGLKMLLGGPADCSSEEIPLRCVAACGDGSARSIPSSSLQGGASSPLSNPHSCGGRGTGDGV